MSLPAPVVQTKAQLLARVAGGQPEQLMLRDFIETVVPGVLESSGNGWVDDEAALNAAAANPANAIISLQPFARYRLSQSWLISQRSNLIIEGNGATLYFRAEDLDNTGTDYKQRNAAGIHIMGPLAAPWVFPSGVTLRNIRLEFEVLDNGRRVDGIVIQNVDNVTLERVEVTGLPIGACVRVNGAQRFVGRDNHLHHCTTDYDGYTLTGDLNIYGFTFDQSRTIVEGIPRNSTISLSGNHIEDLTVGPLFEAAFGYQTDGLNANSLTSGEVIGGHLHGLGEGIDWFGVDTQFIGIRIEDCAYYGIAFKHSTARCAVDSCRINDTGLVGILLAPGLADIDGITVTDSYVLGITSATGTRSCIRLDADNAGFKVQNALISSNVFRPSGTGEYAVHVRGTGGSIDIQGNVETPGTSGSFLDEQSTVRSHVPVDFFLRGSKTFDPGSIADGAAEETTVTVAGAALGDVAACSFSLTTAGVIMTAFVSAADTVTVRFQNETGAPVDLASGTLRALVMQS